MTTSRVDVEPWINAITTAVLRDWIEALLVATCKEDVPLLRIQFTGATRPMVWHQRVENAVAAFQFGCISSWR